MAARASWSGVLEFGLITIPIKLYRKTSSSSGVRFRTLNAETGNPISMKKVDSVTGAPAVELSKGYELQDNTIVEMTIEEVKELVPDRSNKLEMLGFIDAGAVESERLDTPYVIQVNDNFARSYSLLTQAMAKTGKAALCRVVLSSKETLVLLRAKHSQLVATTLLWDDEIRDIESTHAQEIAGEELDLAVKLVEKQEKDIDFSEITETFKEKVEELAMEKLANGGQPAKPMKKANNKTGSKELDLLEALQASIGE